METSMYKIWYRIGSSVGRYVGRLEHFEEAPNEKE
jgi:hypothetical protein